MMQSAVMLLPQPDSPTRPSTRPRLERERHPVDGPRRTGVGGKDHAEIADLEERHHPAVAAASRGSTRGVEGGANSVPSSGTLVSTVS